jgi:protein gp37
VAEHTKIEWTDATWNPVTGCSIVSPGCTHCYAMKLAGTRLRHHASRKGLTDETRAGPVWNGKVRLNEAWLTQPLRWNKPRRIFVCAHGDLFHEKVPDAWIDKVFAVMALSPQHTFQVLTKRAERMRNHFGVGRERMQTRWLWAARDVLGDDADGHIPGAWPLPNVWLGVSAERQQEADERIPHLLNTPAAIRFVSCEPLIGAIDLRGINASGDGTVYNAVDGLRGVSLLHVEPCAKLDWIIVGGESGPGARPMHPDWARSLRDQCEAAGVPFFFKQWGEWCPDTGPLAASDPIFEGRGPCAKYANGAWEISENGFTMPLGGDGEWVFRLGKKRAGRLLDGAEHSEFPA